MARGRRWVGLAARCSPLMLYNPLRPPTRLADQRWHRARVGSADAPHPNAPANRPGAVPLAVVGNAVLSALLRTDRRL